jgi:hypothetical protein
MADDRGGAWKRLSADSRLRVGVFRSGRKVHHGTGRIGHSWLVHLARGLSLASRPDSFGMFLFLLSVLVPFLWETTSGSLCLSLLLGVSGFLAKPYFLLGVPCTCAYLFAFKSKRAGASYGFGALLLLAATFFVMQHFFPYYLVMGTALGLHPGNRILYYDQLISPFLYWVIVSQVERLPRLRIPCLVLLVSTFWAWSPATQFPPRMQEQEWRALESLIATHRHVLASGPLAHLLRRQGKTIYDSGQTEYFVMGYTATSEISPRHT